MALDAGRPQACRPPLGEYRRKEQNLAPAFDSLRKQVAAVVDAICRPHKPAHRSEETSKAQEITPESIEVQPWLPFAG